MTAAQWTAQWKRLDHFQLPAGSNRHGVGVEWFAQLQHYHVDAVERAITEVIGLAHDHFMPGLGVVREKIQERFDRYARTHGACDTCHGSTWIEAQPWKANGQVYSGVQRCPDCGVPAPKVEARRSAPLTSVEYHEYHAGRYLRSQMPPGMDAKARPEGEPTELRAAMEALRVKLFGPKARGDAA